MNGKKERVLEAEVSSGLRWLREKLLCLPQCWKLSEHLGMFSLKLAEVCCLWRVPQPGQGGWKQCWCHSARLDPRAPGW
jgi:hypothetical protein